MPTQEKVYRQLIGFKNKEKLKKYFKSKDEEMIIINWDLIEKYNHRLHEIFSKINNAIFGDYKLSNEDFSLFLDDFNNAYNKLKDFDIIKNKFNNNGRANEYVYYNWMRGYLVSTYFKKVISIIFDVEESDITLLGSDNLNSIQSIDDINNFSKDAIADLQIRSKNIHIEVQAGFSGENDIKKSKSSNAYIKHKEDNTETFIVHFDLLNGRVAVINITKLEKNTTVSWVENKKLEGVYTTAIPDRCFLWRITEQMPNTIICEL